MQINKQIMKEYPWYDYTFFLKLMRVWLTEASEQHITNGVTLSAARISKKMRIMANLLDRLEKDDYDGEKIYVEGRVSSCLVPWTVSKLNCRIRGVEWDTYKHLAGQQLYGSEYFPDRETYQKRSKLAASHNAAQRKQDKELFSKLFTKHLEEFWD